MVKYINIFLGGFLGIVGIVLGAYLLVLHLSGLKSFGVPYLSPFAASDINDYQDLKDALVRGPLRTLARRPFYARREQRIRMGGKERDHVRR